MRQCIGCQEMKSKKEMIRVIKTPEDEICIDATGRKNGRGASVLNGFLQTFTLRTAGRGDEEY